MVVQCESFFPNLQGQSPTKQPSSLVLFLYYLEWGLTIKLLIMNVILFLLQSYLFLFCKRLMLEIEN